MKILKSEFLKQTTTVRFGWTCDNDLRNLGENVLYESEREGDKASNVWIPKVNIDHLMEKNAWCLI